MKPFCPSSGADFWGTLVFSHALTSSRNVFSVSLRSKATRLILTSCGLSDRRNHLGGEQLQRIRVVEQEVLQHEEVNSQRSHLVDLARDLLRRAHEPAFSRCFQNVVRREVLVARDHLADLVRPLAQLVPIPADQKARHDRTADRRGIASEDRKSTRLNSSHDQISYAVFC